jgi:hypothetical protein
MATHRLGQKLEEDGLFRNAGSKSENKNMSFCCI